MPRRSGRDQLIGNFRAERSEQFEIADEERQMGIVRHGIECVDFH